MDVVEVQDSELFHDQAASYSQLEVLKDEIAEWHGLQLKTKGV